jgi:hypothetical protein
MSSIVDFWTEKMLDIIPIWSWPKWCLQIYEQDLTNYPVNYDRNILALKESNDDYLRYFKASRGYSRPLGCHPNIWSLMQQGNTVLYYPEYFAHIVNQTKVYPEDCELMSCIETLCSVPTHNWMNISKSNTQFTSESKNMNENANRNTNTLDANGYEGNSNNFSEVANRGSTVAHNIPQDVNLNINKGDNNVNDDINQDDDEDDECVDTTTADDEDDEDSR